MSNEITAGFDLVGMLKFAEEVSREAAGEATTNAQRIVRVDGKEYVWVAEKPIDIQHYLKVDNECRDRSLAEFLEPRIECVESATLQSVVDFNAISEHGLWASLSEQRVDLWTSARRLDGAHARVLCALSPACDFPFGKFMSVEAFVTSVASWFEPSAETTRLLELFKKGVTISDVSLASDDGLSQKVELQTRTGLAEVVDLGDPSFQLRPYRTFREIAQPESRFMLRMKRFGGGDEKEVKAALLEIDSESWKLEAVADIRKKLQDLGADMPLVG